MTSDEFKLQHPIGPRGARTLQLAYADATSEVSSANEEDEDEDDEEDDDDDETDALNDWT